MCVFIVVVYFFFFQAEDGIRDHCVTGVQTCALPISPKNKDGEKLRERLTKSKMVWRKESMEKRPRSGPMVRCL